MAHPAVAVVSAPHKGLVLLPQAPADLPAADGSSDMRALAVALLPHLREQLLAERQDSAPPSADLDSLADAIAERVITRLGVGPDRDSEPAATLIDAPAAARVLGITEDAFRSRLQRGQIPRAAIVRTGRRVQFRPRQLVRRH